MSGVTATDERMLGGLSAEGWDRLAGRNFYSSAGWLSYCETEYGGETGAVVVDRGGEPACAVPFAEVGDRLLWTYRWQDVLTAHGLPAPPPRGILVGPREGYQTHVLSPPGPAPTTAELEQLVAQLRELQTKGGDPAEQRGCVAMYVTTPDALALQRAGAPATPVLLFADAWVEVPEGGWAAWEASLSSHRRSNMHRDVRRFGAAGYHVEHLPLAECWDRLGEMAAASQAKYGHDADPEEERRALHHHVTCMGDAARVAVCRIGDGELTGFCLYYVWADTVFIRWSGFDYDRLVGASEYFNLVLYAQLELVSSLGLRWVHAAPGSTETKALRGAELRPLWLVDLAEDSVLAGASTEIRRHNARGYELLKADRQTAGAIADPEEWEVFL